MRRVNPVALVAAIICSGVLLAPFISLTSEHFSWQSYTTVYQSLAIPAVARVQGAGGAFFTSRIDLFHTGSGNMTLSATYTPRADITGTPQTVTLTLPVGTQQEVDDPLGSWFNFGSGQTAVGSLLVDVTGGVAPGGGNVLLAQSVVYARNADGSEYGQDFPALTESDALTAGQVGYLTSAVDAQAYRVNVGLMGLVTPTEATVTLEDPIGTPLAPGQTFTLDAGGNRQLNNIFHVFNLTPRNNILVAVSVASGKLLAYASILDGNVTYTGTSDPTTILPVTAGTPEVTLLELGPIQGLNEFSGSASLVNFSSVPAQVRADFFARGVPGVAATANVTIPAGGVVGYENIIGSLFSLQGVGTLRLTATNGTLISATGREYSLFRNAQGTVTGTAGQGMPGMLPGELLNAGTTYHLLGLREQTVGTLKERSHIAGFNPGTSDVTLNVALYGETGLLEGQHQIAIRAGELIQVNSIIAVVNPAQDGQPKRLEVDSTGPLYVRAFRVNPWGDPITIAPQGG